MRGYTRSKAVIYIMQVSRLTQVQIQKILYVLEYTGGHDRDQHTD